MTYPQAMPPSTALADGRPPSIRTAVWLMYLGALLSLINIFVGMAAKDSVLDDVRRQAVESGKSAVEADAAVNDISGPYTAAVLFGGVIGILLWLWMVWKNGQGRKWARIVATVLFATHTLSLIGAFIGAPGTSGPALWLSVLMWIVGLAALYFLWRRDAGDYYDRMSMRT